MKRKMLAEERTLRRHLGFLKAITTEGISEHKITMKLISALVRAVEERCAKRCEAQAAFYRSLMAKGPGGMVDADIARAIAADDCAAAIRRGND